MVSFELKSKTNVADKCFHFLSIHFQAMASSWASYKYGNPSWILLVVYSVLIFSAYTVGIPATLQCFNSNPPRPSSPHFSMAPWIYLYGYSLVSFIPAIVIWAFLTVLFSSTLLDAALVLIPTILSAAFVLQNAPMISPLDFPRRCILGVTHLIFLSSLWGLFVTPPSPPGFDFYVLAMTYQPEFCNFPAPCAYPGPQETFSLHGLWPEWKNGTWPSTCSTDPLIDSTIRRVGLKRMEKYWPDLKSEYGNGKKYASLWEHEWSKHGTCSGLSQDVYLSVTLDNDLRMPRKVRRSIGGSIDKWELIQAFGGRNKVVTVCSRGASLTEIRVCLAADRLGYPTRRIQCPRFVLEQDNCKNADVFLRGV
jgi:ribonuclease T2